MRLESLTEELYPNILKSNPIESIASVRGRITSIRTAGKKLAFIDVKNEVHAYQVIIKKDVTEMKTIRNVIDKAQIGDIYEFNGSFGHSKSGQDSLFAVNGKMLAPCLRPIPLELKKKSHLPVLNYLVNPDAVQKLKTRSQLIRVLRDFLHSRNFTEVETPILGTKAGGANATPFKTKLETWKLDLFLRIAPELYLKQLVIGGMDRVFEIGKQFRNEGIDASHNPEFTTCEVYEAYTDLEHVITCIQDLFIRFAQSTHNSTRITTHDGVEIDFAKPFHRMYVIEELQKHLGTLPDVNDSRSIPEWVALLESKGMSVPKPTTLPRILDYLISELIEPNCVEPTLIMGHPQSMSPLSKSFDGVSTARFELFVQRKELVNAYVELNDPKIQKECFEKQVKDKNLGDGEAQAMDEQYCESLEYGLPPTVGWGLGIDRVAMLFTKTGQIRDVIAFPITKPE